MNKLFLLCMLFVSSVGFANWSEGTIARVTESGKVVHEPAGMRGVNYTHVGKDFKASVVKTGHIVDPYGQKMLSRSVATRAMPTKLVAATSIAARRNTYVQIAAMIGEPLILAGFEHAENQHSPTGGQDWWKRTDDQKKIFQSRDFQFPRTKQCGDKNICAKGSTASMSCPGGAARGISQRVHCLKLQDDGWGGMGWLTDGSIDVIEYYDNLRPASDGELAEGLTLHMGAARGNLVDEIRKINSSFGDGEADEVKFEPNSVYTSTPYTPSKTISGVGTAGAPQQTQVSTDAQGNGTARYIARPDLQADSDNAPSANPKPAPNPDGGGENGNGNGNGNNGGEKETAFLCELFPTILACADYTPPPDLDPSFDEEEIDFSIKEEVIIPDIAQCPAPRIATFTNGNSFVFSYNKVCEVSVDYIKPVLKFCTVLICSLMVIGSLKNG